jgi:copper resistance protein C
MKTSNIHGTRLTARSKPWRRVLAVMLVVVLGQVAGVLPAGAHSDLVDSSPGPHSVQHGPVSDVRLRFTSELSPGLAAVVVRGPRGGDHVEGVPAVFEDRLLVALEPLRIAGTYDVSYRVVAADGHAISGSYRFVLSKSGAAAARRVEVSVESWSEPATTRDSRTSEVGVPVSSGASVGAEAAAGRWWTDAGVLGVMLALLLALGGSLAFGVRTTSARRTADAGKERSL